MNRVTVEIDGRRVSGPLPLARALAFARSLLRHVPGLDRRRIAFADA